MRSSKSRSRGKSNRNNRSAGNNINRVYDSSGPEGKVRGTPQQIIEKYQQLTRDAQLSNDRVAAENFQQHAEHYARILGEAQREAEARRLEHEAQQRQRAAQREEEQAQQQQQKREDEANIDPSDAPQPDFDAVVEDAGDSQLVETPESDAPARKPRPPRQRRAPKAEKPVEEATSGDGDTPEAAE